MAQITWADKNTGDTFRASDANEIKSVVNDNRLDFTMVRELSDFPTPVDGVITLSGAYLDAKFTGNTTSQVIGTDWVDVTPVFTIDYSQRFTYDAGTKSFQYVGIREKLIRGKFAYFAESSTNNQDIQFSLFRDTGEGFVELARTRFDFTFRFSDTTAYLPIDFRVEVAESHKFKMMARKPSGSSTFTFLSGKAII